MEALQNLTRGSREMLPCVSTTSIHCQDVHAHSMSSSLCWQLKLWTETTPSCSGQKPMSHCCCLAAGAGAVELQEEQVLLQETSWSWLQQLLLPLQQTAFLTGAWTYWSPNLFDPPKPSTSAIPVSNQAFSSPHSLLYPTKDVVKQNLWSLYSNRASNSAHTAARKEGEREDVPYKRMWLLLLQQLKKMLREVRQQRGMINSAEWEGRRIRTAQLEQDRADGQ